MEALRQAYSEGRYADAWLHYRRLVALGEAGAAEHMWGARAADAQSDLYGARWAADQAVAAEPAGPLRVEVHLTRGIILQEIGEPLAAIADLRACISALNDCPDLAPVMAPAAWFNLGLAYRQTGRFAQAAPAYRHAAALARQENLQTYLCQALHNLAWVECIAGNRTEAGEALAEAQLLCSTDHLKWHQRVGEAFLESLGDLTEQRRALELCDQIAAHPGDDLPPAVRSHGYWLAGRISLDLFALDAAEGFAASAVAWGAKARGENGCLTDAAELLRSVRLIRTGEQPAGA